MSDTINGDIANQYLTFSCDDVSYGVGLRFINDIIELPAQITPLPGMPDYTCGIFNLRGTILPVIDLRVRFGRARKPYHPRTCVIVLSVDDIAVGIVVDAVQEVLTAKDGQYAKPPFDTRASNRFVVYMLQPGGDGSPVVQLLDEHKLLFDEQAEEALELQRV